MFIAYLHGSVSKLSLALGGDKANIIDQLALTSVVLTVVEAAILT